MKKILLLSLLISSSVYGQKYEASQVISRTSLVETQIQGLGNKAKFFFEVRGDTIISNPGENQKIYINNVKEILENGKIETWVEFIEENITDDGLRNAIQPVINLYKVNTFTGIKRWNQFRLRLSKKQ